LLVVLVGDLRRDEPGRNGLGRRLQVLGVELRLVLDRIGLLPLGAQLEPVREELEVAEDLDERQAGHASPSISLAQAGERFYSSRCSFRNCSMAALVSGSGSPPTASSSCLPISFTVLRFSCTRAASFSRAISSSSGCIAFCLLSISSRLAIRQSSSDRSDRDPRGPVKGAGERPRC